ncbi:protein of unknown function [Xenorhabdus nematophila AN6/1]|nr:hypothetical protein XNA1_4770013 [Xenorhabdus nematophila str. Anatoliense]CEE96009.1 hypothetical protein XNA1_930013 [Xenorhabdus nematophila str. Anatoliense]CEF30395.1 hypothetical protein XNW1_2480045 [Xenorhabdus nematophila str. Websteri]CEF34006.1 hypothetical protein XNW1_750044 [Xenorhabdus nematophila str. Websteri]CEK23068.1 protein of unknown function [Xenorhabdus nematophila AN6/1]
MRRANTAVVLRRIVKKAVIILKIITGDKAITSFSVRQFFTVE